MQQNKSLSAKGQIMTEAIVGEIVTVESTALATNGHVNAGNMAMLDAGDDDQRIMQMWIDKPRKSKTKGTKKQYAPFGWKLLGELPPLQSVNYGDLLSWYQRQENADISAHTFKTRVSYMKSFFSFATRLGYLRANPAEMIETPATGDATHERILTETEVIKILATTANQRDRILIRTLYSSALRVSELLALTWQDVTPLETGGALLHVKSGKGGKSRAADISAETYSELLSLRGEYLPATAHIFRSNRGNALDRTVVNRMVRKAAQRAGIDRPVSPHWFRHSSLSHAANKGANLKALQAKSGHSSLDMLSKYLHSKDRTSELLAV